jgi:hypothetical protein
MIEDKKYLCQVSLMESVTLKEQQKTQHQISKLPEVLIVPLCKNTYSVSPI